MKCARSQELLSAFLDRELDEAETAALTAHLAGCESCSEELKALQTVKLALRSMAAPRCPDSVWLNLSERMAKEPAPVLPARRAPLVSPAWAVAAAAMLAVGAIRPPGQGTSTFQALLQGPPAPPVESESLASIASLPLSAQRSSTGSLSAATASRGSFSPGAVSPGARSRGHTPAELAGQPPAPRLSAASSGALHGEGAVGDRVAMLPLENGVTGRRTGEQLEAPALPLRPAAVVRVRRFTISARPQLSTGPGTRAVMSGERRGHPDTVPRATPRDHAPTQGHVLVALLPAAALRIAPAIAGRPEARSPWSFGRSLAQHLEPAPASHEGAATPSTTGTMTPATTSSIVSLAAMATDQTGDDAAAEQTGKDLLGMALEAGAVTRDGGA